MWRELVRHGFNRNKSLRDDFLQKRLRAAEAGMTSDGLPMTSFNFGQLPVSILTADGHRQLHFVPIELIGTAADKRPRRQHIVKRRQSVSPAGLVKNREVL